ncbi:MAG: cyclopropane-fatty-acyl-phospholipid synthase family protein [Candidatus Nanopelagicales bacterium]
MKIAEAFDQLAGGDIDVEFVAYDGSKGGHVGSDIRLEVRSPRAIAALLGAPGQLGLARAYITGDLEVTGDLYTAFDRLANAALREVSWPERMRLARHFAPFFLRKPPPPPEEARIGGSRHSRRRDAQVISHHYDVSNRFYEWVLGPTMAYTCAVFPRADASLEQAQIEKFDLVCRKLGLEPGMRVLDVGCGWGGFALHAASNYGVEVIAVTLSEQQARWGQRAAAEAGLGHVVDIRHSDYRAVPETGFDRVASIGLTEHIGKSNYPSYFDFLRSRLVDGGRLLNHCITRTDPTARTYTRNGFINRYVFPDGELVHVGTLVDAIERQQLEVQHEENLRVHYAMTLGFWLDNLQAHWDEAVQEVGLRKARVWRLYLAASKWGFARNQIQLHQVLATRTSATGESGMPLRLRLESPQG